MHPTHEDVDWDEAEYYDWLDNHTCYYTETPDGWGCPTCLYH